ncbi:MAG: molybdenum cofactor guanylyltransferase [Verrucomicrobiota bacterium]
MKNGAKKPGNPTCEAVILAGGLSTRMGRDKARLRLGRRTLLGHVRHAAREAGLKVRVVRRDLVERCGPLGGIYTGLRKSHAQWVLYLSCDMPLVSARLLRELLGKRARGVGAVFTEENGVVGFPLLLRRDCLAVVEEQIASKEYSMQRLAAKLSAKRWQPPKAWRGELFNVNTPEEWAEAQARARR